MSANSKTLAETVKNHRIAILISFALFVAFLGLFWWTWIYDDGRYHVAQIRFDAEAWRRADPIENHRIVRSKMIDDLLRRHDFHGWTRPQVEELLGPPEPGGGKFGFPQFDVVYILGMERAGAFSLDDEALGFSFDDRGTVSKYSLSVN